jgi:hypothetical protein
MLALAKGHPPGLVFVPFAAAVWLLGHGALWLANRLVDRSERVAREQGRATGKWPPFLVLLAFCSGVVFFGGLLLIVGGGQFGGANLKELAILLVIWLPPALCFVGILLRKYWAMYFASAAFLAVAAYFVFEVTYSMVRGRAHPLKEWIFVIIVISLCVFLAIYVLRSRAIKGFFARP